MLRVLLTAILCLAAPAAAVADSAPAPAAPVAPTVAPAPAAPAVIVVPAPAALDSHAAPNSDLTPLPELQPMESPGYLLFKTLLVLGLVVAIIYLTLNVGARRLLQLAPPSQALVQVVERVPLDAKKTLFVLSAAGEYLLVGSTDAGLSLLSKLPVEPVQQALARRDAARAQSGSFLSRLQALGPTGRKPPP